MLFFDFQVVTTPSSFVTENNQRTDVYFPEKTPLNYYALAERLKKFY